jgi:iron complex transport system substrate-binding protein
METNLEQIIALEPQVLIMSVMAQTEDQVAQLEAAGIKVVVSDAQDIAGVYTAIGMLGALTGYDAEAAEVVSGMQATLDSLRRARGEWMARGLF